MFKNQDENEQESSLPASAEYKNNSFDPTIVLKGLEHFHRHIILVEVSKEKCFVTYANPAALNALDLDESILGKSFEEVLSPESAAYFSEKYKEAVETNQAITLKDEVEGVSGKKVYQESILSPFIHQGRTYVFTSVQDVTEINIERERLLRSKRNEERLTSLVEYNPNPVLLLNNHGYILEANQAMEKTIGFSDQYLIGRHYSEFMSLEDRKVVDEYFPKALQGEPVVYESKIYHRDGYEIIFQMTNIPIIVDGEVQGVYGVVRNLTKERIEFNQLSKEKYLYESFIQRIPKAIVILDRNHKITFANRKFSQLYGFTEEELLGRKLPTIPEWLINQQEEFNQQALEGEILESVELKRQNKAGELLDVRAQVFGIGDDEGCISNIVWIETDITEQKRIEIQAKKEKEGLEYIWENTSDGLCLVSINGIIERVNKSFEKMFGVNRTEVEQKRFVEVRREYGQAKIESILESLREQKKPVHVITEKTIADGDVQQIQVTFQPIQRDNLLALVIYRDVSEMVEKFKKLERSEEMYRTIVEKLPETIVIHKEGKIRYINQKGIDELRAKNPKQIIGMDALQLVHPDDLEKVKKRMMLAESNQQPQVQKAERFLRLDGTSIIASASNIPIKLQGETNVLVTIRDETARQMAEQAIRESEERFRIIAENSTDIIKILNPKGIITYVSPALEYVLGYPVREFLGHSFIESVYEEDRELIRKVVNEIFETKEQQDVEVRRIHQDGHHVWLHSSTVPILDEAGEIDKIMVISRDISENKRKEEKLSRLAFYDALTGLPNRRLFEERFEQAKFTTDRTGELTALMVLDGDHLKSINDRHGHDVGDEVIKEFARRIKQSLRKTDTVSRLGGDEFTVVFPEIMSEDIVADIAERILSDVRAPMKIGDAEIVLTVSIGIAFYPKHGQTYEEVFKAADVNLYHAKEMGRNTYYMG